MPGIEPVAQHQAGAAIAAPATAEDCGACAEPDGSCDSAPGRNRTCDSRFRKSMQSRLPTCENTLKGASDQAIPSLEHPSLPDVSRSFAGPARGQSADDVIQDQRHNVSEQVRARLAAGGPLVQDP